MKFRLLAAVVFCLWLLPGGGAAMAQQEPAQAARGPLAVEAATELDSVKAALDPIEAALGREGLDEAALMDLRDRIEPLRIRLEGVIARLQPEIDLINQRLAELGEAPKEEQPAESPETARERAAQGAALKNVDEVQRRARVLALQATQMSDSATARRRALFADQLFRKQPSLLSPDLWLATAAGLPKDLASVSMMVSDTAQRAETRLDGARALVLALAAVIAVLLWWPGRRWANHLGQRYAVQQVPAHRLRRSAHALWVVVVTVAAPTLAALVLLYGLRLSDLMTARLEPLALTLVAAVAFVAFIDGLAKGILSPDKVSWRLPDMTDELASGIRSQAGIVSTVYAIGLIISSLNLVVVTRLEATVLTDGLFAVANALTFALALRVLRSAQQDDDPSTPDANPVLGLFRIVVWIAIAVIILSALAGYIAFAAFLAHQVIWITIVGAMLYLLTALTDDLFTIGFSGQGAMSRWIHDTIGLKRASVELIGVLLSGFCRLALYGMALLAVLAPWGIGSFDAMGWFRALAFGFSIGGFRVSISAILLAVAILAVGVLITRAVQTWLENRLLPKTKIEPGLQNSIRTGIGYLGVILAGVFALGTVGLNLQNVAIVAGALSVGIGFGLQSIVNNFVSGLILLAERPVKVGDWVEIGSSEGNIRKISVRATEIELFDRSTLIVPNSELISKAVINKTHANPLGRVKITFTVPADSDLARVRRALLDSAETHMDVMEDPGPSVTLGAIGSSSLELTLIAFVATPRRVSAVKSELQFDITRRFREDGIVIPVAAPDAQAESIREVAKAIEALPDRIAALLPQARAGSVSPKKT